MTNGEKPVLRCLFSLLFEMTRSGNYLGMDALKLFAQYFMDSHGQMNTFYSMFHTLYFILSLLIIHLPQ